MEKETNYYEEIKIAIAAFLEAFDGCIIKRINNRGKTIQKVAVRYVYAPKQRVIYDLVDKAQNMSLPVVAVWMTGISRDETRVFNKISGSQYDLVRHNPNYRQESLQPVPVNITLSMSILTGFQSDMDQILSNFVPYLDPYIIVSYKHPYIKQDLKTLSENPSLSSTVVYDHQEIRMEVRWDGNIPLKYPIELDEGKKYRVGADTTFTIKAWLFKHKDDDSLSKIFKIQNTFNVGTIFDDSIGESEIQTILGVPRINFVAPYEIGQNYTGDITLHGYMFKNVTDVYLSANNGSMFGALSTISPFSSLTSDYYVDNGYNLSFNGISAEYEFINDNIINVTIPTLSSTGKFDIILVDNDSYSGWTKMTTTLSSSNYDYYNYPAVSGISVF